MTTLTDFLLARIAEDETQAEQVRLPVRDGSALGVLSLMVGGHDEPGSHDGPGAAVVISPSRIKAECAAKRCIVEQCRHIIDSFGDWDADPDGLKMWPNVNRRERSHAHARLHVLAAVYADHEDYREEWRP